MFHCVHVVAMMHARMKYTVSNFSKIYAYSDKRTVHRFIMERNVQMLFSEEYYPILSRHTKSSTMPKSEIPRQTISACPLNFDVRSSIFPDIKRECIAVKDSLSFVINIRLKSKLFTFHVKEYSCKKLFLFDEKLCMPSWE